MCLQVHIFCTCITCARVRGHVVYFTQKRRHTSAVLPSSQGNQSMYRKRKREGGRYKWGKNWKGGEREKELEERSERQREREGGRVSGSKMSTPGCSLALTDGECGLVSGLQSNPYKQSDHSLCLNSTALHAKPVRTHNFSCTHAHTCSCDNRKGLRDFAVRARWKTFAWINPAFMNALGDGRAEVTGGGRKRPEI